MTEIFRLPLCFSVPLSRRLDRFGAPPLRGVRHVYPVRRLGANAREMCLREFR
jgi:hypothetical protein